MHGHDQQEFSHQDPKHHITPLSTYFVIFFLLLALTAITTAVAFVDLGPLSTPLAFFIAICKGMLVLLFFMHVRHSTRLTWVVVGSSFFMLGVLFVLTLSDYLSRGWKL
jgi:cytochrome c oxidase subunit 4